MTMLQTQERPLTLVFAFPWETLYNEDGELYYHNETEDRTQWKRPPAITELREAAKMQRKMVKQYGKQIKLDKNSRWIGYIDLENESPIAYFMRQGSKVVTYQVPSQGVSRWDTCFMFEALTPKTVRVYKAPAAR